MGEKVNLDTRFAQDSVFHIQPEIACAENRLLNLVPDYGGRDA